MKNGEREKKEHLSRKTSKREPLKDEKLNTNTVERDDEAAGGQVKGGAEESQQRVHGDARDVTVLRQVGCEDLLDCKEPKQVDEHEVHLLARAARQEHGEEACTHVHVLVGGNRGMPREQVLYRRRS